MPEHRIDRSSGEDDDILELAPEEPAEPHPALSRRPPEADPRGAAKPCPGCGYDIRGLRSGVCPECGRSLDRAPGSVLATVSTRSSWLDTKALVYAGVGLLAGAVTYAIAEDPLLGPLAFGVDFVATVIIGWVVFLVCSMMWIGFDQPLRMTVVQLIGAYGGYAGVSAVLGYIPFFGFFAFIISAIVLIGLLGDLLDIEYKDAFVIALISGVAKWLVHMWVFTILLAD